MPARKNIELNGESKVEKTAKPSEVLKQVFITNDNTYEDVVRYQELGTEVYFDDTPGKLIELSAEQVASFPSLLRVKYAQARNIHDRLAAEDPAWIEIQRKLQIQQSDYASPMDKVGRNIAKPGLVTRNARIDRIEHWKSKGFEVARPEHMASPKMRQVEGHYEVSSKGEIESVLMVSTEENVDRLMKERHEKHERAAKRVEEQNEGVLKSTGYKIVK